MNEDCSETSKQVTFFVNVAGFALRGRACNKKQSPSNICSNKPKTTGHTSIKINKHLFLNENNNINKNNFAKVW